MRAGFIVTGVLGLGTAAVFGLAAVAATAFPQGSTVSAMWNGAWTKGGVGIAQPMPMPVAVPAPSVVVVNDSAGGAGTAAPADAAPPSK